MPGPRCVPRLPGPERRAGRDAPRRPGGVPRRGCGSSRVRSGTSGGALVAATLEGAPPSSASHPSGRRAARLPARVAPGRPLRGRQLPPSGREGPRDRSGGRRLGAARNDRRPSRCRARRSFVLGVQWELHEEWQDDERMLGIWEAFVDDARRRMEERGGRGAATASIEAHDRRGRRAPARSRFWQAALRYPSDARRAAPSSCSFRPAGDTRPGRGDPAGGRDRAREEPRPPRPPCRRRRRGGGSPAGRSAPRSEWTIERRRTAGAAGRRCPIRRERCSACVPRDRRIAPNRTSKGGPQDDAPGARAVRRDRRRRPRPLHGLALGEGLRDPGDGDGSDVVILDKTGSGGGAVRHRLRRDPQQLLPAGDARADGALGAGLGIGSRGVPLSPRSATCRSAPEVMRPMSPRSTSSRRRSVTRRS